MLRERLGGRPEVPGGAIHSVLSLEEPREADSVRRNGLCALRRGNIALDEILEPEGLISVPLRPSRRILVELHNQGLLGMSSSGGGLNLAFDGQKSG